MREVIEFRGEDHTIAGWARIIGITPTSLRARFARGWSIEEALSTPRTNGGHHKDEAKLADCYGCYYWKTLNGSPQKNGIRACHYANEQHLKGQSGTRIKKVDGKAVCPPAGKGRCPYWKDG